MDHEHRGVAYHKIVLSPGQDEPVEDWREWTRDVMSDLRAEHQHPGRSKRNWPR